MQAEARMGDVGLQVKGSSLCRLLLLIGESGQAGRECVSYAKLHSWRAI